MITLLTLQSFTISVTPSLILGYTASNGLSSSIIFLETQQQTIRGASVSTVTQSTIDNMPINDPYLYEVLLKDSELGFEYYAEKYELNANINYRFIYYKWNSLNSQFQYYKGILWESELSRGRSGHKVKGFYTDYYNTDKTHWGPGGPNPV